MRASSNAPPLIREACTAPPENGGTGQVPAAQEPQLSGVFSPGAWADAMESLLHEQEGILASLEQLSSRQADCIRSGCVDGLLKVLGCRQELVTRFLDVQTDLGALKNMHDDQVLRIDQVVQNRLHERMRLLDLMLQNVLEQDDRDHTKLLQQREAVEHRVNQLDAGVRATARYASFNSTAVSRNFDPGARA